MIRLVSEFITAAVHGNDLPDRTVNALAIRKLNESDSFFNKIIAATLRISYPIAVSGKISLDHSVDFAACRFLLSYFLHVLPHVLNSQKNEFSVCC